MWDLNDYIETWLWSHRCASNMQIRTSSQKSAVKQEDPVQKFLQTNAHFLFKLFGVAFLFYLVW